jgi:hypothetical protein
MLLLSSISATAFKDINGGHSTVSTTVISPRGMLIVETRSRASATVLFIFQFPATSGVRMLKLPLCYENFNPVEH